MQEDKSPVLESLLPDVDSEVGLNFPQDNFSVPDQLFAESSTSDIGTEDVSPAPDFKTNHQTDSIDKDMPSSDGKKDVNSSKSVTKDSLPPAPPKQSSSPSMNPVNKTAPLKVTALPVKQTNNQLIFIPMNQVNSSVLQSNIKVPAGQNIVIIKPEDLLKTVEGKTLKIITTKTPPIGSTTGPKIVIKHGNMVPNQKGGPQTSTQAPLKVQAHRDGQVSVQVQPDIQVNQLNEEQNQANQPVEKSPLGENLAVNLEKKTGQHSHTHTEPNKAVSQAEGNQNLSQLGNGLEQEGDHPTQVTGDTINDEQSKQVTMKLETTTSKPAVVTQKVSGVTISKPQDNEKKQTPNLYQSKPATSESVSLSQTGSIDKLQQKNQPTQSHTITKISREMQTIPTKTSVGTQQNLTTRPCDPDSDLLRKSSLRTSPDAKTLQKVQASATKETVQKSLESKAVIQTEQALRKNLSKAKNPSPQHLQGSSSKTPFVSLPKDTTKSNVQSPVSMAHPPYVIRQVGPIANLSSKADSATKPRVPSVLRTAQKPQNHTPSVWPSSAQNVVALKNEVHMNKPVQRRGRPRKQVLESNAKSTKINKVDSVKGPTLLGELERKGPNASSRLKTVRPGDSQLKIIKQTKVTGSNLWRCSLCGKTSFENSLGCLYGPYDETNDVSQMDSQPIGHKRKLSSTTDESESPMKLKAGSSSTSSPELWFHGECIIWSPGIYAVGESLGGYKQAVNDGRFGKCSSCGNYGATLVCFQRTCKKMYHFFCAKKAGCIFRESNYTIQCGHHK